MKTIGLIGGMTWNSTAIYYKLLNKIINKKLGGHHSGECIIYSLDFAEIERLQHRGDWQELSNIMCKTAERLEKAGADMILICANTMHKVADDVEDDINIPVIHITDAVAVKIKEQNIHKVGLLGTKFTMEHDFYKSRIKDTYGINVLIPEGRDLIGVNRIIYEELAKGVFKEESKQRFIEIIAKLKKRGAEGIIMGCTEIPMLIKQSDVDLPLFDTVKIHVQKAIEFAMV